MQYKAFFIKFQIKMIVFLCRRKVFLRVPQGTPYESNYHNSKNLKPLLLKMVMKNAVSKN